MMSFFIVATVENYLEYSQRPKEGDPLMQKSNVWESIYLVDSFGILTTKD